MMGVDVTIIHCVHDVVTHDDTDLWKGWTYRWVGGRTAASLVFRPHSCQREPQTSPEGQYRILPVSARLCNP